MTLDQFVLARDILYELASVGDLPLPQPSPQGGTKRERDSDSPTVPSRPLSPPKESPRTIAGTRRISRDVHTVSQQPRQQQAPPASQPQLYNLPVYSNDLGRLPLHGEVDFLMTGATGPSSSSGSVHPSNMWYTSLSTGAPQQPGSVPGHGQGFTQGDAYSFDDLFMDQIPGPFGGFSAPPPPPPAHQRDAAAVTNDCELQAFMDAAVSTAGVPPTTTATMMETNEMVDVDPDTIAMWSCAPTGFGWVFFLSLNFYFVLSVVDFDFSGVG